MTRGKPAIDLTDQKFNRLTVTHRAPNAENSSRIDNDKGYFPDNLRWATKKEQAQNRGSYDRNVRHLRRECECGMISNPGAIGRHAKSTGHKVKHDYV